MPDFKAGDAVWVLWNGRMSAAEIVSVDRDWTSFDIAEPHPETWDVRRRDKGVTFYPRNPALNGADKPNS